MPINDPIRDRKVAPNSLAFPIAGAAGGAVSSSTYQSTVQDVVNNTVVYADSEVQNRDRHALSTADREAEHRSKAWVGDWHRVIDWDITVDQDITNNAWDPLRFSNEAMRAMGAISTPTSWSWTVAPGWEGTYFLYAFVCINITSAAAVGAVRLGIIVNGTLRTVIDRVDAEISGDDAAFVRDCIVRGGRNVSLGVGDVVQIAVNFGGAVGNATYLHPSSVVGYVSGFRTMCGFDHIINTQDDIDGYAFT
jgi:hypothetical protein